MSRRLFLGLLPAYLLLRIVLGQFPGYASDTEMVREIVLGSAQHGLLQAYDTTPFDYPPFWLYIMVPVGKVALWLGADAETTAPWFILLIRLPNLIFDLLIAWLVYRLVGRMRSWGDDRAGPGAGRLAAVAYLFNPAIFFAATYWGTPDSIHTALALASVSLLIADRWPQSAVSLSLGAMMKPLVAPLLPLLAVFAWLRGGWKKVAIVGVSGLAAAIAVFLPFIATGRGASTFRTVASDLNVMPYTSVNAHNLWWLAGGGWKPANAPLLGPITPTMIGLVIFGIVFGLLTVRCRDWIRATDPPRGYATNVCLFAAAICSTFFFVTTHMHENHMFLTVALLTCVLGRSRTLLWLTIAATLTMLANMFLHDPELPYRLPLGLSDPTSSLDQAGRPYTPLQVVGSVVNSLLAGVVTAGLCLATWKTGGALPGTAHSPATIRGLPHPGQSAR